MNAAIYIRKSREDKSKPAHWLTVQRQQLPAYAKSQGWTPEKSGTLPALNLLTSLPSTLDLPCGVHLGSGLEK